MRLIDADDKNLQRELFTYIRPTGIDEMPYEDATQALDKAPTIDVKPVIKGKWTDSHIPESVLSECSVCHYACGSYAFNYCPNCGADMRESEG